MDIDHYAIWSYTKGRERLCQFEREQAYKPRPFTSADLSLTVAVYGPAIISYYTTSLFAHSL